MVQTAEKFTDRVGSDVLTFGVAFCLNIDAVQPERVLIYHAVHSAIAAATDRSAGIRLGPTEAHAEKQLHNQALEKIRRRCANAVEQVLRQRFLDLPMRHPHNLIRSLGLADQHWLDRVFIQRRLIFGLPELRVLAQKFQIDPRRRRRQNFLTEFCDFQMGTPRVLNQACFTEMKLRPMHAVGE